MYQVNGVTYRVGLPLENTFQLKKQDGTQVIDTGAFAAYTSDGLITYSTFDLKDASRSPQDVDSTGFTEFDLTSDMSASFATRHPLTTFEYQPMTVQKLFPRQGYVSGHNPVQIYGSHFANSEHLVCKFGSHNPVRAAWLSHHLVRFAIDLHLFRLTLTLPTPLCRLSAAHRQTRQTDQQRFLSSLRIWIRPGGCGITGKCSQRLAKISWRVFLCPTGRASLQIALPTTSRLLRHRIGSRKIREAGIWTIP